MSVELNFSVAMQVATQVSGIQTLGIAVSGGGDSMALLQLAHVWAGEHGIKLVAATVNHGLRPEAADEAQMVAETCAALGILHDILHWQDWNRQGNLQDAARRARYGLLTEWAQKVGADAVALGHTEDDQAETFLMRLARGSGVDGLSAMRGDWQTDGVRWLRPLKSGSRQDLRDYLTARDLKWAEDPSNEDTRFDRVKARKALEILAPLGIDSARLRDTARNMSMARGALRHYAHRAAQDFCRAEAGDILMDAAIGELPAETSHRLFSDALMWVSGAEYRPRLDAALESFALALGGKPRTLHGCLIALKDGKVRITREYQAVKDEVCAPDQLWDGRWQITGPGEGVEIRALGEAVKDCPDWRDTGLPRASLMASPAVWRGAELVAAPLAGLTGGYSATIHPKYKDFFTSVLSH